jgi:hypothetical protein
MRHTLCWTLYIVCDIFDVPKVSEIGYYFRCRNKIMFQNYWGFGLFPSSGILETRKYDVSETVCFRLQPRREDTQLGPSERANLDHWTF